MTKRPYHKYVFDIKKRKFVGQFEKMYLAEDGKNFDSWFQDDMTHLGKQVSILLINRYNFNSILDIGCGKGALTSYLKKNNNKVVGIDMSDTAIKKAKARFPHIEFQKVTIKQALSKREWDLVIMAEVLSYLKHWKEVLASVASRANYLFISLYIPDNPIGFVKSFDDLRKELEKHFTFENELLWNSSCVLLMVKSKSKKLPLHLREV